MPLAPVDLHAAAGVGVADPGEQEQVVLTAGQALVTEDHCRVAELGLDLDADLSELLLNDLEGELAQSVSGGRLEAERQRLAVALVGPSSLAGTAVVLEKRGGLFGVTAVLPEVVLVVGERCS